jgi:hypothetical protein
MRGLDVAAVAQEIRNVRAMIADLIKVVEGLPASRPGSLVITKLDEADLWLGRLAKLIGAE